MTSFQLVREHDLRVWLFAPPDGRYEGYQEIKLEDGHMILIPKRLFIQVATEATPETRATPTGHKTRHFDENGASEIFDAVHDTSFEIGRQVIIDADTTDIGGYTIKAVTIMRPEREISDRDISTGLHIHKWTKIALQAVTQHHDPSMPKGHYTSPHGNSGRNILKRIQEQPAPRSGRPPAKQEIRDRAFELAADTKRPKEVHYQLSKEFPNETPSQRTISRWLKEVRASEVSK